MLEFPPARWSHGPLDGFGELGAGTTMEEGRFQHDHEHGAVARQSYLWRVALRRDVLPERGRWQRVWTTLQPTSGGTEPANAGARYSWYRMAIGCSSGTITAT